MAGIFLIKEKIRSTNIEIRNPPAEISNDINSKPVLNFEFRFCFEFRNSNFEFIYGYTQL